MEAMQPIDKVLQREKGKGEKGKKKKGN